MAQDPSVQRVGCYVDGFNLYFGLRDSKLRRYYWLNIAGLAQKLIIPNKQMLAFTKYFTARISGGRPSDTPSKRTERDAKRKRQVDYIDALESVRNLDVIEGHYREDPRSCNHCGAIWYVPEEKMTDVNIATHMLIDAFANRFDVALLISGDSDLVPPVREILHWFPHKRVNVAFPPGRFSNELKKAVSGQFVIGKQKLRKSQFPDRVVLRSGHEIARPASWK